jgi:hypothetical protein
VPKTSLERRLIDVGGRLRKLRGDLAEANEQLAALQSDADDSQLRALISEKLLEVQKAKNDARHTSSMKKHIAKILADIAKAEREQDALLEEYSRA